MLTSLWSAWQWVWRMLLREPEDEREEGLIEGAFQIGVLILLAFVGLFVAIALLSRL